MSGSITFPCRSGHQRYVMPPGTPERASQCRCDRGPLLGERHGTCVRCGRHTKATIDQTWQDRARKIAGKRS